MARPRTICARIFEKIQDEALASGAITPGMVLEMTNASADTVKAHATAGGNVAPLLVAIENELKGDGTDTNYASGDRVQYVIPRAGDHVYLRVKDGQNVAKANLLESDGAGAVQVHTADTESLGADSAGNLTTIYSNQIVAMALEACDMSTSSAGDDDGWVLALVV